MSTQIVPQHRPKAHSTGIPEWTPEQKQQIAEKAYHYFLARGGEPGYEINDWLRAEAEFAASLKKKPGARSTPAADA